MLEKILFVVLIVLALILGANTIASHARTGELRAAHDSLVIALRNGDRSRALAAFLSTRAAQAEQRADSLAHAGRVAHVKYVAVRDAAPAECAPLAAAAEEEIALAHEETQEVRSALGDTRAALDSVRASYDRLRSAAVTLDHVAAPSWRERLVPKLGFGAAAGVDPFTRRPAMAVGVTLGWTF